MGLTGRDQRVLIHSFVAPHPANVALYQPIIASLRHRQMENKCDGDGLHINYVGDDHLCFLGVKGGGNILSIGKILNIHTEHYFVTA